MLGGNEMTLQELQEYTKNNSHHGVNSTVILNHFIRYIQMCTDPHNIFRFMQQKAICTFLPYYWIRKAEYFAQIGDFSGSFQCIQQAQSRNGIIQDERQLSNQNSQKTININKKHIQLLHRMINQMKSYPPKNKRTVQEFQLLASGIAITSIQQKQSREKYQKLLSIYQDKYGGLRKEKMKIFKMKTAKMCQSWIAEVYQKQEIQQKKIQEKIHQNSVRLSRQVKYHSMHTPLKFRDPQRLTKTMDSVQILRKKRSTNQKSSKKRKNSNDDFEQNTIGKQISQTKMVSSVPVGKSFSNLKRRVTFEMIRDKNDEDSQTEQESEPNLITNHKKKSEVAVNSSSEQISQQFKSLPNPPNKKYE